MGIRPWRNLPDPELDDELVVSKREIEGSPVSRYAGRVPVRLLRPSGAADPLRLRLRASVHQRPRPLARRRLDSGAQHGPPKGDGADLRVEDILSHDGPRAGARPPPCEARGEAMAVTARAASLRGSRGRQRPDRVRGCSRGPGGGMEPAGIRVKRHGVRHAGERPAAPSLPWGQVVEITPPERDAEASLADLQTLLERRGLRGGDAAQRCRAVDLQPCARRGRVCCRVAGPTGGRPRWHSTNGFSSKRPAGRASRSRQRSFAGWATRCWRGASCPWPSSRAADPVHGGRLVRDANDSAAAAAPAAEARPGGRSDPGATVARRRRRWPVWPAGPQGLLALSAHRRIRMMNPHGSGSSACPSIAVEPGCRALPSECWAMSAGGACSCSSSCGTAVAVVHGAERTAMGQHGAGSPAGLEYPAWAVGTSPTRLRARRTRRREGMCRHLGRELVHC